MKLYDTIHLLLDKKNQQLTFISMLFTIIYYTSNLNVALKAENFANMSKS